MGRRGYRITFLLSYTLDSAPLLAFLSTASPTPQVLTLAREAKKKKRAPQTKRSHLFNMDFVPVHICTLDIETRTARDTALGVDSKVCAPHRLLCDILENVLALARAAVGREEDVQNG